MKPARGTLVVRVVFSHHIDVNIGSIRGAEISEAKDAGAIRNAIDGCGSLGRMQHTMKCSRLKHLRIVICGRELLVHSAIHHEPLWPEPVPGGEQNDGEYGSVQRNVVIEYAVLVIGVVQLGAETEACRCGFAERAPRRLTCQRLGAMK